MPHLHFTADHTPAPTLPPREKLDQYGAESLSSWELVAILLRTGVRSKNYSEDVLTLAKRLIAEYGFRGLFSQNSPELLKNSAGIFNHHARTIAAVSEIVRRSAGKFQEFDASTAEKIAERFAFLQTAKQEQCHILHIDREGKAIFSELIAMGGGNSVSVSPREVFRSALWLGAEKIAIIHNHLGTPKPSTEDITWTRRISATARENFQIETIDHIILGQNSYFSFSEKCLL